MEIKIKVEGWRELMTILDENGISRTPAYAGFGIEIYQDAPRKVQVVFEISPEGRGEGVVRIRGGE